VAGSASEQVAVAAAASAADLDAPAGEPRTEDTEVAIEPADPVDAAPGPAGPADAAPGPAGREAVKRDRRPPPRTAKRTAAVDPKAARVAKEPKDAPEAKHAGDEREGKAAGDPETDAPARDGATAAAPPPAPDVAKQAAAAPAGPRPGTVDQDGVRAVVRAHMGEIQACVGRARMEDRDLKGSVTLRIALAGNGRVRGAAVASSKGAGPGLEACLIKAVAAWSFPAPAGGVAATIRYPFSF
jgi:TonB family protein